MNNEEIKNEFISCIEGTHALNLAVSILEDNDELKNEIERLQNIIEEVRELLKNDYFEDGSFTSYKKVFELLDMENK